MKKRNRDKGGSGLGKVAEAVGTFNAAALLSLEGARTDNRIAKATEATAKGISELKREIRKNRAEFK